VVLESYGEFLDQEENTSTTNNGTFAVADGGGMNLGSGSG
jgi:hypothetical protein